ncbi:HAD family hydrolase [Candidatus Uhrbacteria bacterium]|nr:HAD family hydrolase [Candidatus Uhrbacteria bacterium]
MQQKGLKTKLIFFDFDGVIVDTLDMAARIIFEKNPFPDVVDHIRRVSEGNVTEQLRKLYAQGRFRWDPEFHIKYSEQLQLLLPVPGIAEMLRKMNSEHALSIVSSSHTDPIRSFLETHNLHTHFEDIDGVDVHHKKTEKMSSQLGKRGLSTHDSVFITDTLGDILEAHELGIPAIGVTWGYHPAETLQKGNPHAIVNTPSEIITHILELFDRI